MAEATVCPGLFDRAWEMEAQLGRSHAGPFPGLLEARACSSARTTPPSSLECAVGGTSCSGSIQRDAICEGNLFLECRDSRWWRCQPPAALGDFGRQEAKAAPSAGGQGRLTAGRARL